MPLVTVSRKAATYQKFVLTTYSDMADALSYLSTRGYSGTITQSKVNSTVTWAMTLQADIGGDAQQALIGYVLVLENDAEVKSYTAARYAALFNG